MVVDGGWAAHEWLAFYHEDDTTFGITVVPGHQSGRIVIPLRSTPYTKDDKKALKDILRAFLLQEYTHHEIREEVVESPKEGTLYGIYAVAKT
jgi:hypothetical protein